MPQPRIISLIASSTETVCALGFESCLVGRSHECDYPPEVGKLPVCSEPKFDIEGSSREIDDRVLHTLRNALSVYRVHADILKELKPTHIITQDHCEVCAVSLKDVEAAARTFLDNKPQIVSLAPNSLEDIYRGIEAIAASLSAGARGRELVKSMQKQLEAIRLRIQPIPVRPTVVCVEWIGPLMAAGNWVPELVQIAGGIDLLGIAKAHTPRISLAELVEADPDKIIVMPCGWGIEKSRQEMEKALAHPEWRRLKAIRSGQLFLTDGNHYFNRPGPRVVESAEILAEILHGGQASFGHEGKGWERFW